MKEIIKGWIARDKDRFASTAFFKNKEPFLSTFTNEWQGDWDPFYLGKCHGLKPGQLKKAKLTIEVT